MKHTLSKGVIESGFTKEVFRRSGLNIYNCYQCGKCSAGCPINYQMDCQPHQVMRMVQLGLKEAALNSKAIWLCISCETCTTRCPRELGPAKVMDALRSIYYEKQEKNGFQPRPFLRELSQRAYQGLLETFEMGAKWNTRTFNAVFLENLRRHGRSYETGLIAGLNAGTGYLFRNLLKGPIMFLKGKMELLPAKVRRTERVRRIFEKIEELEDTKL